MSTSKVPTATVKEMNVSNCSFVAQRGTLSEAHADAIKALAEALTANANAIRAVAENMKPQPGKLECGIRVG